MLGDGHRPSRPLVQRLLRELSVADSDNLYLLLPRTVGL